MIYPVSSPTSRANHQARYTMDPYFPMPMAMTDPEAAFHLNLISTNEWDLVPSIHDTLPYTYCKTVKVYRRCVETELIVAFSSYQSSQPYPSAAGYSSSKAQPLPPPDPCLVHETAPRTSSFQSLGSIPMNAWTTSSISHTAYQQEAVVARPITTVQESSGSTTSSISQASSSSQIQPSSRSLPNDHIGTTLELPYHHNKSPLIEYKPKRSTGVEPSMSRSWLQWTSLFLTQQPSSSPTRTTAIRTTDRMSFMRYNLL